MKKYTMIIEALPPLPTEVAVLLALAAELGNLEDLPNFDPTRATVQVSFASGNVGRARLELAVVA